MLLLLYCWLIGVREKYFMSGKNQRKLKLKINGHPGLNLRDFEVII